MNMTILLAALAICESGTPKHPEGNDHARGRAGEVSRYQITPEVWHEHVRHPYAGPEHKTTAFWVADVIVRSRVSAYGKATGRQDLLPGDIAPEYVYALWHRPGKLAKAGYTLSGLTKREKARCVRFAKVYATLLEKGGKWEP